MQIHGLEELNRALLTRAVQCFNKGDLEGFLGLFDRSIRVHGLPSGVRGITWIRDFFHDLSDALPDAQIEIEYALVARGRIAMRATLRGTYMGAFRGTTATGETVSIGSASIFEMAHGAVVQLWSEWPALLARALEGDLGTPVTPSDETAESRRSTYQFGTAQPV